MSNKFMKGQNQGFEDPDEVQVLPPDSSEAAIWSKPIPQLLHGHTVKSVSAREKLLVTSDHPYQGKAELPAVWICANKEYNAEQGFSTLISISHQGVSKAQKT
jgi:hypothetical protein